MTFDFYSAVSISKNISTTATLPSDGSNYGKLQIVDNACPIIQRTFTADNVSQTDIETVISQAAVRNRLFTITTSLGTTYTGRVISAQAQQIPGADLWSISLTMQDTSQELPGTGQAVYVIQ